MEEPQRVPKSDIPIAKETSEKEPGDIDNNADVKNAAKPMKDGQNDNKKSDRGAPRIIMAYIPASAPASPPAPGRNTPEATNGGGRPETPNLTAKLNQAIDEYRAREERVGDLGQLDDEGYEGDTYSEGEHQGCCDHDHENQFAAHDEQYSPLHLQQGYNGHSSSVNAPGCWTPYHPASRAPLYMQPPFVPPFQQQQQQQYAVPCYPPVFQPYSFSFPSAPYFPHPHDYRYFPNPHHHQHFSTTLPPPTHPFAPPARPSHFQPIPPYAHPFPPHHHFQHPQSQDPNVLELTQRLHNIQAQLNGLDAAHEVEIWRHGKYNFHRRRAKQLRKIKREKVEEMVTVVRELRALGIEGYGRRHHQPQPQGQQETWTQEMMGWTTAPGWGYGAGFEPGWGHGYQQEQWLGGGYGYGHGHKHGRGQSKVEVEVEHNGKNGRGGCDEDGAHVVSPPTDSAVERMACECPCGCTTVDGEAGLVGEMPGETRARALSLDGMREQIKAVEAREKQQGDSSGNVEQGESAEKNSSCARAGSWSDAQVVVSEELRGNWRKKMRE